MDKYEFKLCLGEIDRLIEEQDYAQAAEIADTIDWEKVKNPETICKISDLYKINGRYEDSVDLLHIARNREPEDPKIVYNLCELELKINQYVEALVYYNEFVQMAPADYRRYVLQYKLYEAQSVSLPERIDVLRKLKASKYVPRWAYELAKLYNEAGDVKACVQECDALIGSGAEGTYVEQARELRSSIIESNEGLDVETPVNAEEETQFTTQNLRETVAESMRQMDEASRNASEIESVLSQEASGQIAMVMPDLPPIETQITGQLNLENIMAEWEKVRAEHEKRRAAQIKQRVLEDTGPMMQRFEEESKQGVLENMEREISLQQRRAELDIPDDLDYAAPGAAYYYNDGGDNLYLDDDGATKAWKPREVRRAEERRQRENIDRESASFSAQYEDYGDGYYDEGYGDGYGYDQPNAGESADSGYYGEEPAGGYEEPYAGQTYAEESYGEEQQPYAGEEPAAADTGVKQEAAPEETPDATAEIAAAPEAAEAVPAGGAETAAFEGPAAGEGTAAEAPAAQEEAVQAPAQPARRPERVPVREEMPGTGERPDAAPVSEETADLIIADPKQSSFLKPEEPPERPAQLRPLTTEEKRLFRPFIHTRKSLAQVTEALDTISLAPYTGNVIITSGEHTEAINLAKALLKEVQQIDANFSGKVAKTRAEVINGKDLSRALGQVENGALIIEEAAELSDESVESLHKELENENRGLIVVLIDKKKLMDRFMEQFPQLQSNFNARIDLIPLTNDELVRIAEKYAMDKGYSFDEFAGLALHTRIAEKQTIDHYVTADEARDIVDEAISYAERKTPGHLMDSIFHKRYDENDLIILHEKDFLHN